MTEEKGLSVSRACQVARLTRAAYYKSGTNWAERDAAVIAAINAAVPDTNEPIIPATSFSVVSSSIPQQSKMLAIDCLTAAVYYEAASEDLTGQRAVAKSS